MEKVGIERDKRIAELRAKTHAQVVECKYLYEPFANACSPYMCPCDKFEAQEYPPYSTNITYAMELWEEMKEGAPTLKLVTFTRYKKRIITCIFSYSRFNDIHATGDTEADAISGCYEKWKESENG